MKEVKAKYDIGVIIGRFQIHELHEAHKGLIDEVLSRHNKVIIFLGVSPTLGTKKNPLDFPTRKRMIEDAYGDKIIAILPVRDNRSDVLWSKSIDTKIREVTPLGSVVLYGSRDSFIPHYSGSFPTCELEPASYVSATEIRIEVSKRVDKSKEFRAGVIYGIYNTHPVVFPTVDIAIMNEDDSEILLGRKPDENQFRFVGGFVDTSDDSYEDAARREAREETGLEIGDLEYITSAKVNDWRYRKEEDRAIITHLFKTKRIFGVPNANDDIVELSWKKIDEVRDNDLVVEHRKLFKILINNIK